MRCAWATLPGTSRTAQQSTLSTTEIANRFVLASVARNLAAAPGLLGSHTVNCLVLLTVKILRIQTDIFFQLILRIPTDIFFLGHSRHLFPIKTSNIFVEYLNSYLTVTSLLFWIYYLRVYNIYISDMDLFVFRFLVEIGYYLYFGYGFIRI